MSIMIVRLPKQAFELRDLTILRPRKTGVCGLRFERLSTTETGIASCDLSIRSFGYQNKAVICGFDYRTIVLLLKQTLSGDKSIVRLIPKQAVELRFDHRSTTKTGLELRFVYFSATRH